MADPAQRRKDFPFLFTGVLAESANECYIHGEVKELSEKSIPHGFVAKYSGNGWRNWFIEAGIASLVKNSVEPGLVVICADGSFSVIGDESRSNGRIDSDVTGPSDRKRILGAIDVDNSIYCVGMSRMAYRRMLDQTWKRISRPIEIADPSQLGLGFRAVGGTSAKEICCVGFEGEIWLYIGLEWVRVQSPTNARLDCICVSDAGQFYVGGANGLVLTGRGDSWNVIDQYLTASSICDVASFQGQIYFSDGRDLMTIREHSVSVVDTKLSPSPAIRYLSSCEEALWAIGRQDILKFDGRQWSRLKLPAPL